MTRRLALAAAVLVLTAGCSSPEFNVLEGDPDGYITAETAARDPEDIENLFKDMANALMGPDRSYYGRIVCDTDNGVVLGTGRYAKDEAGAQETGLDVGDYIFEPTGADCP
jgi:hypothetical protein